MKTILIGLAAAAFLSGTADARSIVVTRDALPTARVSYADLNLASVAGRATLQGRIRSAADTVCEVMGDRSLKTQLAVLSCYHVAVADGLPGRPHYRAQAERSDGRDRGHYRPRQVSSRHKASL